MGLDDDADASFGGLGQDFRHGYLGPGMEMKLRLLDKYHLPWPGGQESHHDGERLRDPKSNIRDVDKVTCSTWFWPDQPSDTQLDFSIIYSPRVHLPGQSQVAQSFA